MSTTSLQKCILATIEKASLSGKKISTKEARNICIKKFPGGIPKFGGKRAKRTKR